MCLGHHWQRVDFAFYVAGNDVMDGHHGGNQLKWGPDSNCLCLAEHSKSISTANRDDPMCTSGYFL